jgi:hypothetical protein
VDKVTVDAARCGGAGTDSGEAEWGGRMGTATQARNGATSIGHADRVAGRVTRAGVSGGRRLSIRVGR